MVVCWVCIVEEGSEEMEEWKRRGMENLASETKDECTNAIESGDILTILKTQAIGAAPDALRMQRVVNFYEKLPRGPAPEVKAKGLLGRYQAKHFGKNPTAKRTLPLEFG